MKATVYYFRLMIIAMVCGSMFYTVSAQNKQNRIDPERAKNGSVNPFPLSEEKRDSLLREAEKSIVFYRAKYNSPNLSTWSEPDCNAYLIARSRRVALLIMPAYYRIYPSNMPAIFRQIASESERNNAGKAYYKVSFYANPDMEDVANSNNELFYVRIWEENGNAWGITSQTTRSGYRFSPPDWEDSVYEDIKKDIKKRFRYFTGYEFMDPITEKYARNKKKEKKEKETQ